MHKKEGEDEASARANLWKLQMCLLKTYLQSILKSHRQKNLFPSACPSAVQERDHVTPEEQSVCSVPIIGLGVSSHGKNQEHLFCFHPSHAVVANVAI